jgi:hypothetical protein
VNFHACSLKRRTSECSDGDGRFPAGVRFHQPRLAVTLERLAEEGLDSFYRAPWRRTSRRIRPRSAAWSVQDLALARPPRLHAWHPTLLQLHDDPVRDLLVKALSAFSARVIFAIRTHGPALRSSKPRAFPYWGGGDLRPERHDAAGAPPTPRRGRPKQNFIAWQRDAHHPRQRLGLAVVVVTDDSAKLGEKVLPNGRVTRSPERSRSRTHQNRESPDMTSPAEPNVSLSLRAAA